MTEVTDRDLPGEVAAELSELAGTVAGFDADQWHAPSLCDGWRIREVVAHMTMPARWSGAAVLGGLLRSGFRWHHFADRAARQDALLPPGDLTAALGGDRLARWRPPGGGVAGALTHAVVHGLDITVPLAIERLPAPGRLRVVLDALTARAALQHFAVDIHDVELRATDLEWTFGSGRLVAADARTLILILSGRRLLDGG